MSASTQKVDTGTKIMRHRGAFSAIVKLQSSRRFVSIALLHTVSGVCTEHALPGENCSQPGVRSEHLIRSQLQPRTSCTYYIVIVVPVVQCLTISCYLWPSMRSILLLLLWDEESKKKMLENQRMKKSWIAVIQQSPWPNVKMRTLHFPLSTHGASYEE